MHPTKYFLVCAHFNVTDAYISVYCLGFCFDILLSISIHILRDELSLQYILKDIEKIEYNYSIHPMYRNVWEVSIILYEKLSMDAVNGDL